MQPLKEAVAEDGRYSQMLRAHQTLFREGESGVYAYIIESGRIQISCTKEGVEQVIAALSPGDIVGEMALIDDQPRSATATALEPTQLKVITRDYLADRISHSDPLLRHVLRRLIQRLRSTLPTHATDDPVLQAAASVVEADQDRVNAVKRLDMAQAIQRGLEQNEFELHLQPIIYLPNGSPTGFEALIRWNRPGVGYVSPMDFIPLAEESDLIMDIGRWTFDTACAHIQRLDAAVPLHDSRSLFVAINLSGRQFTDPRLFKMVESVLQKCRIEPKRLKLEVTETVLIQNFDVAAKVLAHLRALGCQLALDDFGTGYSSLSYLNRFPVDMLKIDRAFVKEVVGSTATQKIVRAIANLGRDLDMAVLAEGIETADDAAMLSSLGVVYGQGYLFGKAMTVERAVGYLGQRRSPLETPADSP